MWRTPMLTLVSVYFIEWGRGCLPFIHATTKFHVYLKQSIYTIEMHFDMWNMYSVTISLTLFKYQVSICGTCGIDSRSRMSSIHTRHDEISRLLIARVVE